MAVGACQSFQFFRQNTWFLKNNGTLPNVLDGFLHCLISIIKLLKRQALKLNAILTTQATLNFVRPRNNDVYNVSHLKGLIFLNYLLVRRNHLKKHKLEYSFLGTLNPICICGFDIETWNHLFLHCPRFTNCIRMKHNPR